MRCPSRKVVGAYSALTAPTSALRRRRSALSTAPATARRPRDRRASRGTPRPRSPRAPGPRAGTRCPGRRPGSVAEPSYVVRVRSASSPSTSRRNCRPFRSPPSIRKVMSCQSQWSAPGNDVTSVVGTRLPSASSQICTPRSSSLVLGQLRGIALRPRLDAPTAVAQVVVDAVGDDERHLGALVDVPRQQHPVVGLGARPGSRRRATGRPSPRCRSSPRAPRSRRPGPPPARRRSPRRRGRTACRRTPAPSLRASARRTARGPGRRPTARSAVPHPHSSSMPSTTVTAARTAVPSPTTVMRQCDGTARHLVPNGDRTLDPVAPAPVRVRVVPGADRAPGTPRSNRWMSPRSWRRPATRSRSAGSTASRTRRTALTVIPAARVSGGGGGGSGKDEKGGDGSGGGLRRQRPAGGRLRHPQRRRHLAPRRRPEPDRRRGRPGPRCLAGQPPEGHPGTGEGQPVAPRVIGASTNP